MCIRQKLESSIRQKLFKLRDKLARSNEQANEKAPASVQDLHEAHKPSILLRGSAKMSRLTRDIGRGRAKAVYYCSFTAVAEHEAALDSKHKPLVDQLDEIRKNAEHVEKRCCRGV